MIDNNHPLIQQSEDPGKWAALFWINSTKVPTNSDRVPIFYEWCVQQFGEPFHSFDPNFDSGRWSIIAGMHTTYVHFKDESDAAHFKLRWYDTDMKA